VAAVEEDRARRELALRPLVANRRPVAHAQPGVVSHCGGEVGHPRRLGFVDHDTVVTQHRGQLRQCGGQGTVGVGSRELQGGTAGGQQGEALRCSETQRFGEQPAHTGEHDSFVDPHIDQLVHERR
jgi:hypothetical protein